MRSFLSMISFLLLVLFLNSNAKGMHSSSVLQPGISPCNSLDAQPVEADKTGSVKMSESENKSAELPSDTILKSLNVMAGQDQFYMANRNLTISGPEKPVVVRNGAALNLASGRSVVFLPGTKVLSGGYLHATIISDAGERSVAARKITRPSDLAKMENANNTTILSETAVPCSPFAKSSKGDFREQGNDDQNFNALAADYSGVITEHNRKNAVVKQTRTQFAPQHLIVFINTSFLTFAGKPEVTRVLRL